VTRRLVHAEFGNLLGPQGVSGSMPRCMVVMAVVLVIGACTSDAPRSPAAATYHSDRADGIAHPSRAITPSDVARVVCASDGIRLDTPVVRAHQDGVRFVSENRGEWWGAELHHQTWDDGTAEGTARFRDDSTTNATSAVAPGRITVACVHASDSGYADVDAASTPLTVVDPEGLYVPWDIVCGFGTQSRVTVQAGRDADPEEAYQQVRGVRASDEFKQPKYPESAQYSAADRVLLRDGAVIARFLGGGGVGGQWDLIVNACPGTGVAGA
jgi:hypothetical protein